MLRAKLLSRPGRPSHTLRVLHNSNFRLYIFGLIVSQIGTWMHYTVQGVLVYRLTRSSLALGLVGFAPMLFLLPLMVVATALADRWPRQKLLTLVQFAFVLPPLVLAALVWTDEVRLWHIIVIEVIMQALGALDVPTRQALVAETVGVEDLGTAVALSTSGLNAARVLGPAIAGGLVAVIGEAPIFALNGLSFLVVGGALLMMRLPARAITANRKSVGGNLADGVRYLMRERLLVASMLLLVLPNLFIMPYLRFIPVFALDILNAGEVGVGTLNALAGVGAVVGSIGLVWIMGRWSKQHGRLGLMVGLWLPVAATAFAFSKSFWLSGLAVVLLGTGMVAVRTLSLTLVHVNVEEELRGRVAGMMVMLAASSTRVGELGVGFLADRLSPPFALTLGAIGCLAGIIVLALLAPRLRKEV